MDDVLIYALAKRVYAGLMTLEQVPELYRDAVKAAVSSMEGSDSNA